ncbi:MAG: alpha/beta hydrolase, partial [Mycobacterium sp.]|nr:alpha/beta hydrolase [Mycobacterium sp.]
MAFFEGNRGRMHYRRWETSGTRAAMLLLPGLGQHSAHYHRFARHLVAAGIELWALDTHGHGLSEGEPEVQGTLHDYVSDALLFRSIAEEHLLGIPMIWMGHSLGAITWMGVLGAAVPPDATSQPPAALHGEYPLRAAIDADSVAGLVLSGAPPRALGGGTAESPETRLPKSLPTMLLHGSEDRIAPIAPARAWAERHPWVDFHEYPDTGHDLLHEPTHQQVSADIV